MRPGRRGPAACFPPPFLAGPACPALATLRSGSAPPARLAARRPAPSPPVGGLRAALAGPPLAPWARLRVFGLRSAGPPCGALRAPWAVALGPLRVGPAPVCAAAGAPCLRPAGRFASGLLPPGGLCPLAGALLRPPAGRGVGCVCVPGAVGGAWNPLRRKKKRLSQSGKTLMTYRQNISLTRSGPYVNLKPNKCSGRG